MLKIELDIEPELAGVEFFGSQDASNDLIWQTTPLVGLADGAISLGIKELIDDETFHVSVEVTSTRRILKDAFLSHDLLIDSEGLEVADVLNSNPEGREGVVGRSFRLPWTGKTTLQFQSPTGFATDRDGNLVPTSLFVLVCPSFN